MAHAAIYDIETGTHAIAHVHSDELWSALKDSVPTARDTVAYGTPEMALEFRRLFREPDSVTSEIRFGVETNFIGRESVY